jgi:hypothetical protein
MDSLINVNICGRCGRPMAGTACACESTGIGIIMAPDITYMWVCPRCGARCQFLGFCQACGWAASPLPQHPPRAPWKCPGCGRYHASHIDTCPSCQPHVVAPDPRFSSQPTDSPPVYVGDPPPVHIDEPVVETTVTTSNIAAPSLAWGACNF